MLLRHYKVKMARYFAQGHGLIRSKFEPKQHDITVHAFNYLYCITFSLIEKKSVHVLINWLILCAL